MTVEWRGDKLHFVVINEWHIVDAQGNVVEILDRSERSHVRDDEWLSRSATRKAEALFAEARAHAEERRDGVQRLAF